MDLRKLAVFCKVYELRSFSRAGEEIYLSQPTVSGHIKYLEDLLEVRLFDRIGREVIPTQAAELLYGFAGRMIELRDEALEALRAYYGRIQGDLKLGASTIPGGYILPRIIGAFTRKYPEVRVRMRVQDTREILRRIQEMQVEIGMVGARVDEEGIVYHPFMEDELILVAPPELVPDRNEPLPLEALKDLPLIMREPGSGTRLSLQNILQSMDMDPGVLNVVAEFGSTEAVRQGVKARLGASILSSRAVEEDIRQGRLKTIPIEGLPVRRDFFLAVHKHRTQSPASRAFLEFCLRPESSEESSSE